MSREDGWKVVSVEPDPNPMWWYHEDGTPLCEGAGWTGGLGNCPVYCSKCEKRVWFKPMPAAERAASVESTR